MGRYYRGDIEGKFWFGVQCSDAAVRFGCTECEPSTIQYYTEDKETVVEEIKRINKNLGKYKKAIKYLYKETGELNERTLADELVDYMFPDKSVEEKEAEKELIDAEFLISEFADLELGKKILRCLNKRGSCSFEADM